MAAPILVDDCCTIYILICSLTSLVQTNMPRCNKCLICLDVLAFRKNNKGNRKKIKVYEKTRICMHPTVSSKKRKLTEAEILLAGGRGGQIRNERLLEQPLLPGPKARLARPKTNFNENSFFNDASYDEYTKLVLKCTAVVESSKSHDVKKEGRSMISKMRGLLDPAVRSEVDYEEAVKDVSNVWIHWSNGEAAGKRAFIPTVEDRDQCYAALRIFSYAADEAKLIPQEFCEEFGEWGIGVYNELIGMIGERDKNYLPFVNMCLRTWLQHLSEDPDIYADMYQFNFDKWVGEKIATHVMHQHGGKTSYDLMMAVFGEKQVTLPTIKKKTPDSFPTNTSTRFVTLFHIFSLFFCPHYSVNFSREYWCSDSGTTV